MKRSILIIFLILLYPIQNAQSNPIMASDLGFRYIGNNTYRVTLKIYRDCQGDSLPTNKDSAFWFAGNNGSKGTPFYHIRLTRISIKDVTSVCSTSTSGCNPKNTTNSGKGVEEHVYIADLDLTKSPLNAVGLGSTFCELNVVFKSCCRNLSITTGAAGETFFTQSSINICNLNKCKYKQSNTCDFTTLPVMNGYCNKATFFNLTAMDTLDHDSFAFQMVEPLKAYNSAATLSFPFSYLKPMTPYCIPSGVNCTPNKSANPPKGFYFDTLTGDIVFAPTQCNEISIFSAAVQEYRKDSSGQWLKVSSVRRELQCSISDNSNNNAPTVQGPAANKVCEGDKICFTISGKDLISSPNQTIPDTVQLNWNQGITRATFEITNPKDREKTAQFCWQTRIGDGSPIAYSFTVTATDEHCPNPMKTTKAFKVFVMTRLTASRNYRCIDSGKIEMESQVAKDFVGTPFYQWSVRDSNGNNESFFSTKRKDTAMLGWGIKHIIVHTINNSSNCPTIYRDTLVCYNTLNLNRNFKILDFNFTPNPIHVGENFDLPTAFNGHIEWYTADGKLVYTYNEKSMLGTVPQIAPGFYLLHLVEGETKRVAKVLIK
jgi:hypothetical protein